MSYFHFPVKKSSFMQFWADLNFIYIQKLVCEWCVFLIFTASGDTMFINSHG